MNLSIEKYSHLEGEMMSMNNRRSSAWSRGLNQILLAYDFFIIFFRFVPINLRKWTPFLMMIFLAQNSNPPNHQRRSKIWSERRKVQKLTPNIKVRINKKINLLLWTLATNIASSKDWEAWMIPSSIKANQSLINPWHSLMITQTLGTSTTTKNKKIKVLKGNWNPWPKIWVSHAPCAKPLQAKLHV